MCALGRSNLRLAERDHNLLRREPARAHRPSSFPPLRDIGRPETHLIPRVAAHLISGEPPGSLTHLSSRRTMLATLWRPELLVNWVLIPTERRDLFRSGGLELRPRRPRRLTAAGMRRVALTHGRTTTYPTVRQRVPLSGGHGRTTFNAGRLRGREVAFRRSPESPGCSVNPDDDREERPVRPTNLIV